MLQTVPFLSIREVAQDLNLGKSTVHRWCQEGKLPYIKVGRATRIPLEPYLKIKANLLRQEWDHTSLSGVFPLIEEWKNHLRNGPRPLSPRTVEGYHYYFLQYLRLIGGASKVNEIASKDTLSRILESIPITSYSNRYNLYYAVCSFTKYMINRQLLNPDAYSSLKSLRPKRYFPARKTVLEADQIERFISAIWTAYGNSPYERKLNFAIIKTFLLTGLRNQELCDLTLVDVDLQRRLLIVKMGKGAKPRQLGVNQELAKVMCEYLNIRPDSSSSAFFVCENGSPLNTGLVTKRIRRLAKAAGVDITAHGLRRTWVTHAAMKGHSIAIISKACGHANIATTQGYLMLSERQVIDAMKEW